MILRIFFCSFFITFFALPFAVVAQTEIGIQLYSFRHQFEKDVPGTLEMIGKMGFKEVEGGGTYGMQLDSFKTLLKKNNLTVVSVGADFKELETNPQAAVDLAKTFGAKYVVCFWIPHDGDNFTLENAQQAVKV